MSHGVFKVTVTVLGLLGSLALGGWAVWCLWRLERTGDELQRFLDRENRP
jgi:hypothetical protein